MALFLTEKLKYFSHIYCFIIDTSAKRNLLYYGTFFCKYNIIYTYHNPIFR